MLDVQSVLISHRITQIYENPFPLFYVDNFLPIEIYSQIVSSFPKPEQFAEGEKFTDGKLFLAKQDYVKYAEEFPIFRKLEKVLNTDAFFVDLGKVCKNNVVKSRSKKFSGKWATRSNPWRKTKLFGNLYAPIRGIRLEISSLPHGAKFPLHTDSSRKIVSLLLYIMPENWESDFSGGTAFYFPKNNHLQAKYSNWENRKLRVDEEAEFQDECDLVQYVDYRANRLVGFVKTDLTYHKIPEIRCVHGCQRGSLNINLMGDRQ